VYLGFPAPTKTAGHQENGDVRAMMTRPLPPVRACKISVAKKNGKQSHCRLKPDHHGEQSEGDGREPEPDDSLHGASQGGHTLSLTLARLLG
jgi:hypothetical protein